MPRLPVLVATLLLALPALAQTIDLTLTRTDQDEPVTPGLPMPYFQAVRNNADVPATGVILTITGAGPITKAPPNCTIEGSRAICEMGTIAPRAFEFVIVDITAPDISEHTFDIVA